jgi:hypothetical protein
MHIHELAGSYAGVEFPDIRANECKYDQAFNILVDAVSIAARTRSMDLLATNRMSPNIRVIRIFCCLLG